MNDLVVGRREEGKTTLAKWLLEQRHAGGIAYDPRGMIEGRVIVHDLDSLEAEMRSGREGWIVFRPAGKEASEDFAEVCDFLFPAGDAHHWRAFGFLVDEAGELQSANQIHPALRRAIAQHYRSGDESVSLVQTSHRLPEFHGKSRALMDNLYIFQTTHPGDLKTLEDYTGDAQISEIVATLPKHHCVRYKFARQPALPVCGFHKNVQNVTAMFAGRI